MAYKFTHPKDCKDHKVIKVLTAEPNDYGDLIVIDELTMQEFKIKKTRKTLFSFFEEQIGRAVKLCMGEYEGYPFVGAANAWAGKVEEGKPSFEEHHEPTKQSTESQPSQTTSPQEKGMLVKELGEYLRCGKLSELVGADNAVEAAKWYRNELLSKLGIPFDGSKFPFPSKRKEEDKPY